MADAIRRDYEAAEQLGVSVHALRKWRRLGKGPRWVRLGERLVGYRESDLSRFLDENTVEPERA